MKNIIKFLEHFLKKQKNMALPLILASCLLVVSLLGTIAQAQAITEENTDWPVVSKEIPGKTPVTKNVPIDLVVKGIYEFNPSKAIEGGWDEVMGNYKGSLYSDIKDLELIEGDQINLIGLIENKGSKKPSSFFVGLYIDGEKVNFDGRKPKFDGLVNVLLPFQTEYELSNGFTWKAKEGDHNLKYVVDINNEIIEENENNNTYEITVNVKKRGNILCKDSDGGENYTKKGITTRLNETQIDTCYQYPEGYVDMCEGNKEGEEDLTGKGNCAIQESFCGTNDKIYAGFHNCLNGCSDGACIETEKVIEVKKKFWSPILDWFKKLFTKRSSM